MKIYVKDVKDVEIESPISDQELAMMVCASLRGVAHSQVLVTQGKKEGLLDTRDIDMERTLPEFVYDRASAA